jgi:hypothetical protein
VVHRRGFILPAPVAGPGFEDAKMPYDPDRVLDAVGDYLEVLVWYDRRWADARQRAMVCRWGTDDPEKITLRQVAESLVIHTSPAPEADPHKYFDRDGERAQFARFVDLSERLSVYASAWGIDNGPLIRFKNNPGVFLVDRPAAIYDTVDAFEAAAVAKLNEASPKRLALPDTTSWHTKTEAAKLLGGSTQNLAKVRGLVVDRLSNRVDPASITRVLLQRSARDDRRFVEESDAEVEAKFPPSSSPRHRD